MKKRIKIKTVSVSGGKSPESPANALANAFGDYILTADGKYIIVNKL